MRKKNTIEINGRRYDAATGTKLAADAAQHQAKKAHVTVPSQAVIKPAEHSDARQAAKPARHVPAPPRTLMRQGLKKPVPSLKRDHKAYGQAGVLVPQALNELAIGSVRRLDEKRLRHAKQIPRSRLISHFPTSTTAWEPTPVQPSNKTARPVQTSMPHPASAKPAAAKPTATAVFLDRAVEQATSHLQPPPAKRRHEHLKRGVGAGAAIVLSVVVLGVIVAQNSTAVRLQMASAKAGFNVSLPAYRPAGFALGQFNYSDGVAAAQFQNQSGHYTITQKPSSWDDLALRDKFVAPNYGQYQTVWAGSRVIYIYGNHNATWVDSGIWYIVQSDGSLSDSQLTRLAASF